MRLEPTNPVRVTGGASCPHECDSIAVGGMRHFQVAPDGAVDVLGTSEATSCQSHPRMGRMLQPCVGPLDVPQKFRVSGNMSPSESKESRLCQTVPDCDQHPLCASCFLVSSYSWKLSGWDSAKCKVLESQKMVGYSGELFMGSWEGEGIHSTDPCFQSC